MHFWRILFSVLCLYRATPKTAHSFFAEFRTFLFSLFVLKKASTKKSHQKFCWHFRFCSVGNFCCSLASVLAFSVPGSKANVFFILLLGRRWKEFMLAISVQPRLLVGVLTGIRVFPLHRKNARLSNRCHVVVSGR